jgi:ankyrin repeat protein
LNLFFLKGCDVNYNGTVYLVKGENFTMDISGLTALHLAVWHHSEQFVEKLLTIPGIIVDPIASDGYTPLLDAVYSGNAMILRMLHAAGADMFALSRRGYLATNIAAYNGDLDVVNTLIELGADIDSVSGFGEMETPLISAAHGGNTGVVAYLFGMGADMDVEDAHNKTALDWAIELGYEDVEQVLLYREKFGC